MDEERATAGLPTGGQGPTRDEAARPRPVQPPSPSGMELRYSGLRTGCQVPTGPGRAVMFRAGLLERRGSQRWRQATRPQCVGRADSLQQLQGTQHPTYATGPGPPSGSTSILIWVLPEGTGGGDPMVRMDPFPSLLLSSSCHPRSVRPVSHDESRYSPPEKAVDGAVQPGRVPHQWISSGAPLDDLRRVLFQGSPREIGVWTLGRGFCGSQDPWKGRGKPARRKGGRASRRDWVDGAVIHPSRRHPLPRLSPPEALQVVEQETWLGVGHGDG
ncbi:hypothetical protein EDB80DRAFT_780543 [Ilyonectria destructans]|nr:hypothetical protein EDB80DRAFT_780543 [Ilyonectria destructans]